MRVGEDAAVTSIEDVKAREIIRVLVTAVDGQLTLGDNIRGKIVRVTFSSTAIDFPVEHELGLIATYYTILGKNQYADFRRGDQAPTTKRLYLRCDTADTVADILVWGMEEDVNA